MKKSISFCPLCASRLEAGDDDQFECEECELRFFIQIVDGGDDDDDDEDEEEEDDRDEEDEEEDDRETDNEDEY